tara:strand:+ start:1277 stop:2023 length:747 start_codon:yes stop_codon:yes gene_type:complete
MNYFFTGIELHPDFGFGITADSYYNSAMHLTDNHYENYSVTQQAEMPENFLFRHSIELYIKSLIIIFHKSLKLNYGDRPFDTDRPQIEIEENKWRDLYSCHYIDILYEYWLTKLLLPFADELKKIASKGEWIETEKISTLLNIVCKYDRDSSYFRYPITKYKELDHDKFTMQKFEVNSLKDHLDNLRNKKSDQKEATLTMLLVDGDKVLEAFENNQNILSDVRDGLKEIAYYFHCIHLMARITICNGM